MVVLSENPITLAEAIALFPARNGRPPSKGTVRNWSIRGVGGVRLETARIGHQLVTSPAAVRRFIEQTNGIHTT